MYVPLHNRSAYSFGLALTLPAELAAFAAAQGLGAIALTDLNGLYAAVAFQQACEKAGVKPIFGAELDAGGIGRVTLLAENLNGYGNLCRLVSLRHLRDAPLAAGDLGDCAEGLICLAGAVEPGGHSRPAEFRDAAGVLRDIFAERLYVELAIHSPTDVPVVRRRAGLADELGIPVVATCASRCLSRGQGLLLQALSSVATLTLLEQGHPEKPGGLDAYSGSGEDRPKALYHLRPPAEMERLFARRPDAIANSMRIAEACNVQLDLSRNRFPAFNSPDGRTAMEHLRALGVAGCRRRYVEEPPLRGIGGRRPTMSEALARLDRELNIIEQVHYAEYFLVFHEINQYCRGRGIATLARGSAADSLICYALGVSHACPFRFDLPFDRFINPERAKFSKMADIDLDLPWDQRDEVIGWVYERWGLDRVAMIGCPNTYHARAAVAELGKIYGLPAHEVHRVTKLLPWMTSANLIESIARSPEARDAILGPPAGGQSTTAGGGHESRHAHRVEEPYRTILQMARDLEGLPRHWSMHPCGLVVSPTPLTNLVPVQPSAKGPLVAQYDMDAIEDLGFVKIDLLGQAGLSVLRDAVASINDCPGDPPHRAGGVEPPVDLTRDVDYSDPITWEMIAGGNARGVHHIESPAMTNLLQQCNCRDIDCLTTVVAIIRPGAANQGKKDAFARRHQGMETSTFVHPSVVPVLEKTYGLMVFEEHILQVAVEFAGMNLGRADVLRRALNKENHRMIEELRGEFCESAFSAGRGAEEIAAVWGLLEGFCGFMFNKAHSAEYAVEAFQGAWLKRRWPAHYIAAILSNYRGFYAHSPTLPQILYVMEALRLGATFLPPCVNRSKPRFGIEQGDDGRVFIRIPITHIHGLPQHFLDAYLAQREAGPFESLAAFIDRCRPGEAEGVALLDSGAFDGFGLTRPEMFWQIHRAARKRRAHRQTLWDSSDCDASEPMPPVELTTPDIHQVAKREMDLLGFPVSVDPLTFLGTNEQGSPIDWGRYVPVSALHQYMGKAVRVCGLMVADRVNATIQGDLMKFVTLADRTGFIEAILFPDAYQRFGHLTAAHPILEATGMVETFENGLGFTLRVMRIGPPHRRTSASAKVRQEEEKKFHERTMTCEAVNLGEQVDRGKAR